MIFINIEYSIYILDGHIDRNKNEREKERKEEIWKHKALLWDYELEKKMLGFLVFLSNCICFTLKNNIFFGNSWEWESEFLK